MTTSENFADRLIRRVREAGNPCVMGLDPRIEQMPEFAARGGVRECICDYHRRLIDMAADLLPAVKPQMAFYEQYGVAGWQALGDTVRYAQERGMIVIVDGKRNDIASTAEAYANALLGRTKALGKTIEGLGADAITVSPYLGSDSLEPFVEACKAYDKGLFVVVKTSNAGSGDLQDRKLAECEELYMAVAKMVERCGEDLVGAEGYSAVGPVVGATHPEQARRLRAALPRSIFLVPGYGAQGAMGREAAACFHADGRGAIVSASRSLTYGFRDRSISPEEWERAVRERIREMVADVNGAIRGVEAGRQAGGPF